jgi:LmbE family N-acetylglucosaminyl deacetylase
MSNQKRLLISPHADDEVYGATSFIDKNTVVFIVGIDECKIPPHIERPSRGTRMEEIDNISERTDAEYIIGDYLVNHYSKRYCDILDSIEELIDRFKPGVVLIPPADTNQDHQTIHKICMTALRPHDKNHFVPTVLEYETPGAVMWGPHSEPNYFAPLDLDKKIDLYKCYKTQIRSYRSIGMLSDLASKRGQQSNMLYAEGFKVVRMCQDQTPKNTGK